MQLNALKGNNMKDTAYFNADMIDADMMIINAMIRKFRLTERRTGMTRTAMNFNDNTMINRVQNADYGKYIVDTNPWISSWFTRLKDTSHMLSRHQMKTCNQFHINSIMLSMIIII